MVQHPDRRTLALTVLLQLGCPADPTDENASTTGSDGTSDDSVNTLTSGATASTSSAESGATSTTTDTASSTTDASSSGVDSSAGEDTSSSAGSDESTTGGCPRPPEALPSGPLTRYDGNPMLRNGPEAYDFWKTGPRVVRVEGPGDYRIWYEAVADETYTTVGYATSDDGLTWTKMGTVMGPVAAWEGNEISPNSMLYENATYVLFYHAGGSQLVNRRIGYATSDDGLDWTRLPDPVLDLGASGEFDDNQVAEPRVIVTDDGYRMYYTGRNEASGLTSLGMATSDDGVTWTKYDGNPILDTAAWGNFWGGAFFLEDGTWHLWHGVTDGGSSWLEYMWSTDGIAWTPGPDNPVLTQNPDGDAADYGLVGDSVSGYRDGDAYRIMYTGFNWNLFGTQGRFEGICLASIDASC